jgi:hypothetical protein
MRKFFRMPLAVLLACVALSSCKDKKDDVPVYDLQTDKSVLTLSYEAYNEALADNSLNVTTDNPDGWIAKIYADESASTELSGDWLELSASAGKSGNIYVKATENSDKAARKAWIVVSAADITRKISVTQNYKPENPGPEPEPETASVKITGEDGESISDLTFEANNGAGGNPVPQKFTVEWTPATKPLIITKSDDGKPFSWQSESNGWKEVSADHNGSYTFTIDPAALDLNKDVFASVASTVKFSVSTTTGDTADATIAMKQENYAIVPQGFTSAQGNNYTITALVKTNVAWKVTVDDSDSVLESYTPESGVANTDGTPFTYTFKKESMGRVAFKFEATDGRDVKRNVAVSIGYVGSSFARSNVIGVDTDGDGKLDKLTFAETEADNATIPANSQGLLFKWGSLIGLAGTGSDGSAFNPADHVVFIPAGYASATPSTWTWDGTDKTLTGIPYHGYDIRPGGVNVDAFAAEAKGYDETTAMGDVCRYISDKGWVSGKWRMPISDEYYNLYEQSTGYMISAGSYVKEAFTEKDGTHKVESGWFVGDGMPDRLTVDLLVSPPEGVVFLPASGDRHNKDGRMYNMGAFGYYWSSSPYAYGGRSYYLWYNSAFIYPTNELTRNSGFSVRCIKAE